TSAVLGDVVNIARTFHHGVTRGVGEKVGGGISPTAINPFSELRTQYYLRLNVLDRAGVLAQIAKVLGDHQISIASVIQKDTDPQAGTAELVISTHLAQEAAVQKALHVIARLEVAKEVSSLIRVEPL
ncbi:MAG: ACT domain-containing protein, partial [Chloroflexi bacterium]|nr:ACT domain-containing protein [Chloroflexota bacterium]